MTDRIISKQGRQGDLFFMRVNELPKDAIPTSDNVLARGEVTGHTHRIEQATVFRSPSTNRLFIQVVNEAELVHEEHAHLRISRGSYEVSRQREFDPLEDKTRVVSD